MVAMRSFIMRLPVYLLLVSLYGVSSKSVDHRDDPGHKDHRASDVLVKHIKERSAYVPAGDDLSGNKYGRQGDYTPYNSYSSKYDDDVYESDANHDVQSGYKRPYKRDYSSYGKPSYSKDGYSSYNPTYKQEYSSYGKPAYARQEDYEPYGRSKYSAYGQDGYVPYKKDSYKAPEYEPYGRYAISKDDEHVYGDDQQQYTSSNAYGRDGYKSPDYLYSNSASAGPYSAESHSDSHSEYGSYKAPSY